METNKKRLLVDLSKLQGPYCGLWEVSRQLGQAIIDTIDYTFWDVTFLVPQHHPFTDSRIHYLQLKWWHRFLLKFHRYDVLHGVAQNTPYLRHKNNRSRYIITLHDLNFLHENQDFSRQKRYLYKYQRNLSGVDHVVSISRFAERDALEHMNLSEIAHSVIYNGVAERPAALPLQSPKGLEDQLQGQDFLFIISTIMRKKNIHVLVDMMKHLPNLCLVIAGRVIHQDYFEKITRKIQEYGLSDRVFLIGPVEDSEKFWLYDHCKAFVFPSLAEGFGIPPVEAMRAGKPVFASRLTSIPEICGDMAFYWDTFAEQDMAQTIDRCLNDANAPQNNADMLKEYAKKYSWKTCSEEYIKIYESLA
ncbi:MAG: glycosyltransferase family 4 protein [Bacteroidales bacterium]|jgi:glycosyltransferase involved in cell wall biosynthesis|nr:glycosyltransferase family 4 protein [Bacteroidales bacterium]